MCIYNRYMYIYIYIHVYTSSYIYIYIQTERERYIFSHNPAKTCQAAILDDSAGAEMRAACTSTGLLKHILPKPIWDEFVRRRHICC